MKPSIGRIVHYTDPDARDAFGKPTPVIAAIITRVHDDSFVELHLFYPVGVSCAPRTFGRPNSEAMANKTDAEAGTPEAAFCWNWPVRVE